MKHWFLFLILIIGSTIACNKDLNEEENPDLLTGPWIFLDYTGSVKTFYRSASFDDNKGGCAFLKNGEFIERANLGWCGTSISYMHYFGKWKIDGSMLCINSKYWDGDAYYEWEIIDLTADSLKINVIKEEYY